MHLGPELVQGCTPSPAAPRQWALDRFGELHGKELLYTYLRSTSMFLKD